MCFMFKHILVRAIDVFEATTLELVATYIGTYMWLANGGILNIRYEQFRTGNEHQKGLILGGRILGLHGCVPMYLPK